jgi:hypothetical protein
MSDAVALNCINAASKAADVDVDIAPLQFQS